MGTPNIQQPSSQEARLVEAGAFLTSPDLCLACRGYALAGGGVAWITCPLHRDHAGCQCCLPEFLVH